MNGYLLPAATFVFLVVFGRALYGLGAGSLRPGRLTLISMTLGFGLLTADLWIRGQALRGCPLNSLFDVLIFLSWSVVLIYLLIGPAYRLSLLGSFTSGLVLIVLLAAQLLPIRRAPAEPVSRDAWVEFHAALSLVAYGAFALAGLAGFMYLLQDRQLKQRKAGKLFYNLPPVTDLAVANARLVWLGFGLLTISFAAGIISGMPVNTVKFWTSLVIWFVYAGVLALRQFRSLAPRRVAVLSMAVFAAALLALPAIQYLSSPR
ncbi:MAG: cytochrome c biogenesis protein CcsA [Terrimicrobiaceae bacterium]|nr:cytochrome c biogenesis protein CcsA [Terrimicrobiaceae bacterium]